MSLVPWGIWASSGGGGVPAFLSSAPLWLDASDSATITQSDGSVSQWNNKGTLENFVQDSGSLQPLTGSATINGLNAIQFSADIMGASTASDWAFLNNGETYFFAIVLRTPTDKFVNFATQSASAGVGAQFLLGNYYTFFRIFRGVGGSYINVDLGDGAVGTSAIIYSGLSDADSATASEKAQLRINDGSASTNSNNVSPSTSDPGYAFRIGLEDSDLLGDLGEVIIVSGEDATETNRQLVENYLNAKWSVF